MSWWWVAGTAVWSSPAGSNVPLSLLKNWTLGSIAFSNFLSLMRGQRAARVRTPVGSLLPSHPERRHPFALFSSPGSLCSLSNWEQLLGCFSLAALLNVFYVQPSHFLPLLSPFKINRSGWARGTSAWASKRGRFLARIFLRNGGWKERPCRYGSESMSSHI